MNTKILKIDSRKPEAKKILEAARIIRKGGLVAFPTETVYGLGANAFNTEAVRKIFRAKGRPFDDPLIVHVCSEKQVYELAEEVAFEAKVLMDKFWPGPLTIVMRKSKKVPAITTANLGTVAIRMPKNRIACALIRKAGVPIAAPSANTFSRPSPTTAGHVLADLKGKIPLILDGGTTRIGIESTVIDLSGKKPVLLRPGAVTLEQLQKTIGKVQVHGAVKSTPGKNKKKIFALAPGMKYRHYAPKAKVILVFGSA
ncbi:MAG: L-threonylcarbamoyladenylate synthase, partial [archaeon]